MVSVYFSKALKNKYKVHILGKSTSSEDDLIEQLDVLAKTLDNELMVCPHLNVKGYKTNGGIALWEAWEIQEEGAL